MFLIFGKSEAWRSYKHGSYKKSVIGYFNSHQIPFFLAGLFGHELVGLFVDAFLNASWIFEYIQSIEPQKEWIDSV